MYGAADCLPRCHGLSVDARACEDIGILSVECVLGEDATEEEVVELVGDLNSRQEIHGILVQLPLPEHMDQQVVLAAICGKH